MSVFTMAARNLGRQALGGIQRRAFSASASRVCTDFSVNHTANGRLPKLLSWVERAESGNLFHCS